MVGTLSALEANNISQEDLVSRSEPGEVFALRVHITHPYSRVSITSAFRIRTFRLSGAVVLSYYSGPNSLKHAHMRRFRRLISNER